MIVGNFDRMLLEGFDYDNFWGLFFEGVEGLLSILEADDRAPGF